MVRMPPKLVQQRDYLTYRRRYVTPVSSIQVLTAIIQLYPPPGPFQLLLLLLVVDQEAEIGYLHTI